MFQLSKGSLRVSGNKANNHSTKNRNIYKPYDIFSIS